MDLESKAPVPLPTSESPLGCTDSDICPVGLPWFPGSTERAVAQWGWKLTPLALSEAVKEAEGWGWKSWNCHSASLNLSSDKALSVSPLYSLIPTLNDKNAIWGGKSGFSFPLLLRKVSPEHHCGKIPLGKHRVSYIKLSPHKHHLVLFFWSGAGWQLCFKWEKTEHKLWLCLTDRANDSTVLLDALYDVFLCASAGKGIQFLHPGDQHWKL